MKLGTTACSVILMSRKILAIIQARMGSSRLPGKVLLQIDQKPMLHYVIKQTMASRFIDNVIIATTNLLEDKKIVGYCKKNSLKYFCGSQKNVLDRYYKCAKKFECEPVIRITSDCPLIDPNVIDKVINKFLKNSYDYVSNNLEKNGNNWNNSTCNFPQGMTTEISDFKTLKKAWKEAKKPSEREHVFPYVQFNPKLFKVSNIKNKTDLSYIRCEVNKIEDLKFVREIYRRIPKKKKAVLSKDILDIVKKEPHLLAINNKISFGEGYKKSQTEDKEHNY